MSDTRSRLASSPARRSSSADVDGVELGMTICYDLRFCELYRILAVGGARIFSIPSAFTLATGRDHWEVLLRARAIENAAFVVAPNQYGEAPPHYSSYGRSAIVDPWGVMLAQAPDEECFVAAELDLEAQERVRESLPALANRRPEAYRWPEPVEGGSLMAKAPPVDRRRQILDAAIRVFARQGFNDCRVSDIAREAEVAYGLVYHYFDSKDQVLNELFVERWSLLLAAIEEVDARADPAAREARRGRRLHHRLLPPRPRADEGDHHRGHPRGELVHPHAPAGDPPGLRADREDRQRRPGRRATSATDVDPEFASMWFYGAIEQLLTGWVFEIIPDGDGDFDRARAMVVETICGGLEKGAANGR